MVKISRLIEGHKEFHQKYFVEQPDVYKKLLEDGQSPKTLVISCSDSRADPSIILNTEPGDIFVIRNVANIVPPYEDENIGYHSTSAAIEYAVLHLKIENIVVLGHSDCGGIKSLIKDQENDHTFIDNWLYIVEDAKKEAIKHNGNFSDVCHICEKEAIKKSIKNLREFPFIKENNVELHGWYFNLQTGSLENIV
ncbi:MAG: carbonic anhydrase [Alphaproteobacteria bacterium]